MAAIFSAGWSRLGGASTGIVETRGTGSDAAADAGAGDGDCEAAGTGAEVVLVAGETGTASPEEGVPALGELGSKVGEEPVAGTVIGFVAAAFVISGCIADGDCEAIPGSFAGSFVTGTPSAPGARKREAWVLLAEFAVTGEDSAEAGTVEVEEGEDGIVWLAGLLSMAGGLAGSKS